MNETLEHLDRELETTGPRLVTFVLPVRDEGRTLRELYGKISAVMEKRPEVCEMVFVDDGSSDDSFAVMAELHQEDRRVRAIQFRRNFGKAAAYTAGFDAARGEVVITMDTDLQDDPEEIPLFLDRIDEGFDMVVGWKHEGKGSLNKRMPSKIFNRVVSSVTGIPLHDFNCPFKAYRREVLGQIRIHGELHRFIPVLAHSRGFSLTEIKIRNLPRQHGYSKYGIERHLRGMLDLLTILFITRFAKRPLHLLGLGGILAFALGFSTVAFLVGAHFLQQLKILTNSSWIIHDRPALSLGILLMLVGLQFFSLGLLGELFVTVAGSLTTERGDRAYSVKRILED